jgi:methyl-accepting chemotaxis protein
MMKNRTISARLGLGFGIVILLLIAMGLFSLNRMAVLADLTQKLYDHPFQVSNAVLQVNSHIIAIHRSMKDIALARNQTQRAKSLEEVNAHERDIYENFDMISARFLGAKEMYETPLEAFRQWKPIRDEVIRHMQMGESEKAYAITVGKGAQHVAFLNREMLKLRDFAHNKAAEFIADAEATRVRTQQLFFFLLVVTCSLGAGISFFISRGITTRISKVVAVATSIIEGDLDVEVPEDSSGDEVGTLMRSFGEMIASLQQQIRVRRQAEEDLQEQVRQIAREAGVLSASIEAITASTRQLASSAMETATSVNETMTTIEEVRQTTELASQKAGEVSAGSQQVVQTAQSGQQATDQTLEGMNQMQTQMAGIAESIVRLSEQSQTIGQIITTVDDLAEQSNLLAVNASIEAARAGEEGKSFAVVAEEIRNLAEQSKQSTRQVRSLLTDIQQATRAAVMAAEQGSKRVEAGVSQAAAAGEAIGTLAESVAESSRAAMQIAASGQQQLTGMDQIVEAMESIREASTQNAASTQQVETSARNLDEVGQRLNKLVSQNQIG